MSILSIRDYQQAVDDWINLVGSQYFAPTTNLCMLAEEVGEVSRLISREFGEQTYKQGERPADVKASLADELADVLFVVTCIANQQDIDLNAALQRNLIKKTNRDKNRYRAS
jgi:NTP pyrophosphatase (non-canonical NTP hydrolase)